MTSLINELQGSLNYDTLGFPDVSIIKNPHANAGNTIESLGWEKEMAAHSSILAWRIPWTEEPGGLQSMGLQRVRHDGVTNNYGALFQVFVLQTASTLI